MRGRHIALSIGANGPKLGFHATGAEYGQAIIENGTGTDRKSFPMARAPEFLASSGVVGDDPMSSGRNHLSAAAAADEQRSDKRFFEIAIVRLYRRTFGSPNGFAGRFVKGDDVLGVASVAHEYEQVFPKDGRTSRADLVIHGKIGSPKDAAIF